MEKLKEEVTAEIRKKERGERRLEILCLIFAAGFMIHVATFQGCVFNVAGTQIAWQKKAESDKISPKLKLQRPVTEPPAPELDP